MRLRVQEERPPQGGPRAPGGRLQHAPQPWRRWEDPPQPSQQLLNLNITLQYLIKPPLPSCIPTYPVISALQSGVGCIAHFPFLLHTGPSLQLRLIPKQHIAYAAPVGRQDHSTAKWPG